MVNVIIHTWMISRGAIRNGMLKIPSCAMEYLKMRCIAWEWRTNYWVHIMQLSVKNMADDLLNMQQVSRK